LKQNESETIFSTLDSPERLHLLMDARDIIGLDGVALEIGVHNGEHAFVINEILQPKKLFLVDSWGRDGVYNPGNESNQYWDECLLKTMSRFTQHQHVEIICGASHTESAKFRNGMFDFIYIDADHAYEAVKKDLENWFPKLRPGGIIAGHDYTDDFFVEIGVIKAVDEFRINNEDKIKDFKTFGSLWNRGWLIETTSTLSTTLRDYND